MKICPKCSVPCDDNACFCDKCGQAFPEPENKSNKLSKIGFILSLVMLACALSAALMSTTFFKKVYFMDYFIIPVKVLVIIAIMGSLASLILSVKGIRQAKMYKLKGKSFGIAGTVLSIVTFTLSVIIAVIDILWIIVLTKIGASIAFRAPEPSETTVETEWRPHTYGVHETNDDNFFVQRINDKENSHECALIKCYWGGDPRYSIINIPASINSNGDYLTIVSLGSSQPDMEGFAIYIKPEEKDFFKTKDYLESPKVGNINVDPTSFGVKPGTSVHYEEIVFNIFVEKYVENIVIGSGSGEPGYLAVINSEYDITFWHYSFRFTVDPDNPVYYSKDGELYTKADDKCVYPEIS